MANSPKSSSQFARLIQAARAKTMRIVDLSRQSFVTFGVGSVKGNPPRCIKCGKPIRRGQPWVKYTSTKPRKYFRYSIIEHSRRCPGNRR